MILSTLFSCVYKNNGPDAGENVVKTLDSLSQSFNRDTLSIAVAKLDSVLSYDENKKYGHYYYKRGYCHTVLGNYEKAIKDLVVSQKMGYNTNKSSELIEYNKGLLDNERKYAPYH
ncbi:hypothetical protein FA048_18680 [Pedobacter polaris]|uniref:Tetratricopeptide repeat protein n=1 Tax=Pedobacter polaris TaxID=2571273 RepID=A0A4U1CG22_9SPHI|nr:hypothetical protein FA048_18680 [Pedobacter polaris]